MALRQHRETVVVPAGRGTIVDRNGEPLAIGKLATTVYANPRQVNNGRVTSRSPPRSSSASTRRRLYPTLVDRSRGFVYVARKADPHKADNLKALDFAGVGFYPEEQRYYPQGPVASQVLGYAGLDNKGLEGLERSLDGTLVGPSGQPDDREGPVRPRARRRRDEARGAGQERPADDRPRHPVERGGRAAADRARAGERARRPRSSWIRTRGRSWRWRARRRSTRTASRRREPTVAETAPSRTRTSRGRPSSS